MSDDNGVKLDPVWRQAVADAVAEFDYGDVIPMTWLYKHFEIEIPDTFSKKEFERLQFAFLSNLDQMKDHLLFDHKKHLSNVRGIGYRIMLPSAHAATAVLKMKHFIRKAFSEAVNIIENTNIEMLSNQELKELSDAKGKIAALWAMNRKQLGKD